MKRYSSKFKYAVVAMAQSSGVSAAAKRYGVSQAGVRIWLKAAKSPVKTVVTQPRVENSSNDSLIAKLSAENMRLKMFVADMVIKQMQ